MDTHLEIKQFRNNDKQEWDNFIDKSKNGTFLHKINYMHYHADRFQDCSLIIKKDEKIVAVLPGNIKGSVYYSHQGLTYGGLITLPETKAEDVISYFDIINQYLKEEKKISKIIYKAIPYIYSSIPAEEDEYALFRMNASLISTRISSVILMNNKLPFSTLRNRCIKKAQKHNLNIKMDYSFEDFWSILNLNLEKSHKAKPVHSLTEIQNLKSLFKDNIKLFSVYDGIECIAGAVVYITNNVAHVQYISANQKGKKLSALDYLFEFLINKVYTKIKYFDFGISVENNGYHLNDGLIFQKQGFGARAVNYRLFKYYL